MNQIVRSYLQIIGAGILVFSIALWIPNRYHPNFAWLIWLVRIVGLPLSIGLMAYPFNKPPKDVAPDYLHRNFKHRSVFEREGLCFVVAYRLRDGFFELVVYYQNRFDRMCVATIQMSGVPKFFQKKSDLEPVTLQLRVGGGEYGVALIPYAVPADRRGKRISFYVAANVSYPAGKGTQLRHTPGLAVAKACVEGRMFHDFWRSIGIFMGLRINMPIPMNAPDTKMAGSKIEIDILEQMNVSAGFEVIPFANKATDQDMKQNQGG